MDTISFSNQIPSHHFQRLIISSVSKFILGFFFSAMALAGRRLRSSLPLFQKMLAAQSVSIQRSIAPRIDSHLNPSSFENLRSYATASSSKEAKIKVPLALFGGSGNYASALFLVAAKGNLLDKVESEILDLVEASKKSPLFSQFIKDLSVPGGTRVKAVQEIFSEAGFSDVTKNFLAILAENGRLRHIESIAKSFVDLTMAHRGEVKAIVTTVIPLPPEEEKQLKETLQEIIGHGKTVKLEQKINQSILGGLVVEFGQKLFDMSIRTRAKQMEKFLRDPVNFDNL